MIAIISLSMLRDNGPLQLIAILLPKGRNENEMKSVLEFERVEKSCKD